MTDESTRHHYGLNGTNGAAPSDLPVTPVPASEAPESELWGVRRYAQIVGWGYQVPEKVITNHDLEQIVDTNDEWIRIRTGIEERHVAADPKETSASLGV